MKYRMLESDTITVCGHTLYRIECVQPFGEVPAGELGGYIESEANLSQDGECWVYGDARVYADARVSEYAWVGDNALVEDNAVVSGKAWIHGHNVVSGNEVITG